MSKNSKAAGEYKALGIMSGSSLDGLDLCLASFKEEDGWTFNIDEYEVIEIPFDLIEALSNSDLVSSSQLFELDVKFGNWIGGVVNKWLKTRIKPDVIGLHGHTVFHQPDDGYSLQIGNGLCLAHQLNIPVVDNFRQKDIHYGGQGAPLVPFGEKYLFPNYDSFINLGGIANISFHGDSVSAWDVAPCNQIFNFLAQKVGKPYDDEGLIASSGNIDQTFFDRLRTLAYFKKKPPKSLNNQWTKEIIKFVPADVGNAMHTYSKFLAAELGGLLAGKDGKVLVSGGGAYNSFLVESIRTQMTNPERIVDVSEEIIDSKEALIFAFLGLQRLLLRPNVLGSVTGASRDVISGTLHI